MTKLTLSSERILIRNLTESDLDDFLSYRSDPEVTKFQNFDVYDRDKATEFILSQKDKAFGIEGEWLQLGIILLSEKKLVGDCAVKITGDSSEIGCTISREYQKKGIAKETVLLLMKYLIDECNIQKIVETTDEENIASQKLLESIGYKKDGLLINNCFIKGKWCNDIQYSMTKEDWQKKIKVV